MKQKPELEKALTGYAEFLGNHFSSVFRTLRYVAMRIHPYAKKGHSVVQVQVYPDYQSYKKSEVSPLHVPSTKGMAIWFYGDSIFIMKPDDIIFWTEHDAKKDILKINDTLSKQYA